MSMQTAKFDKARIIRALSYYVKAVVSREELVDNIIVYPCDSSKNLAGMLKFDFEPELIEAAIRLNLRASYDTTISIEEVRINLSEETINCGMGEYRDVTIIAEVDYEDWDN